MWCSYPLTCFEEDDLIVLTEVHEASDALGKLHHVVDGVGDVDGTLLPHRFCGLQRQNNMRTDTNHTKHCSKRHRLRTFIW